MIPARMKVVEEIRYKYACQCTVQTATKPAQPNPKSTTSASLLAEVINSGQVSLPSPATPARAALVGARRHVVPQGHFGLVGPGGLTAEDAV